MKKALGCSILSAALVGGLGLPAQAVGLPGADPAEGSTGSQVTALATAMTPAAAARLRPALRLGSRSPAVVYVQSTLGVQPASGYYGPLTVKAVKAAQKAHGLKATGRVTASTWKVLLTSATTAPASDPAPTEPPAAPAGTAPTPEQAARAKPSLAPGSRGPAVVYVQEKLGIAPATGYYGTLTTAAVTALQGAHDVKSTGKVGAATWTVLLAAEGVIALPPTGAQATTDAPATDADPATDPATTPATTAAPTAPAAPAPPAVTPEQAAAARPLLSPGMGPADPAVVFVQKYLRVSPATGYFGRLTTAAVKAYQAGLGIGATGTVDATTWDALLAGRTAVPTPATAPPTPAPATIPTPAYALPANPTAADRAVVFALAQVGKPYVLGGNGPEVFDCSGLIQQAFLASGVKLPRLASQQRFAGTEVSVDQLLPGDLLYYQDGSSPRKGHISMYAGNGLVVEAANPRRGVRIRTLHERWYRDRFVAAVRIS